MLFSLPLFYLPWLPWHSSLLWWKMCSLAYSVHLFLSLREGRSGNSKNSISRAGLENRKSGRGERWVRFECWSLFIGWCSVGDIIWKSILLFKRWNQRTWRPLAYRISYRPFNISYIRPMIICWQINFLEHVWSLFLFISLGLWFLIQAVHLTLSAF